jgi:L-lactate dehydrogenase complex protein LldG
MTTKNSLTARAEILQRIRAANGPTPGAATAQAAWSALARDYKRSSTLPNDAVLDLLADRLRDYDAQVVRSTLADLPRTVAALLTARSMQRLVIPAGLPPEWLPQGFTFMPDHSMSSAELDRVDGVITASTLAIAETGTIVLQNVPGQGRRAISLVPDYHLCLVHADSVVETVPESMAILHPTATLPTTFVSGPSATADIEMTRIKGVHGPRFLDVILILSPSQVPPN